MRCLGFSSTVKTAHKCLAPTLECPSFGEILHLPRQPGKSLLSASNVLLVFQTKNSNYHKVLSLALLMDGIPETAIED